MKNVIIAKIKTWDKMRDDPNFVPIKDFLMDMPTKIPFTRDVEEDLPPSRIIILEPSNDIENNKYVWKDKDALVYIITDNMIEKVLPKEKYIEYLL